LALATDFRYLKKLFSIFIYLLEYLV